MNRGTLNFKPVASTGPSFNTTLGSTSAFYALESTAIGRVWQGPTGRSIRFVNLTANDYYVNFGSTTVVAASTDSLALLGGTVEVITAPYPRVTHIAVAGATTDVTINVTLGYGG